MKNRDELCRDLLECTGDLLQAAEWNDPDGIRETIARRQRILDRLKADNFRQPTEEQRAVLTRVMEIDARARQETAALLAKKRDEIRETNRRFDSQMEYKRSGYGLSSGMVMDKKR